MKKLLILGGLLLTLISAAQEVTYIGRVANPNTLEPIPFAVVLIKSVESQEILAGGQSDFDGNFEVTGPVEGVVLELRTIGFEPLIIDLSSYPVGPEAKIIKLGTLYFTEQVETLQEVKVQAERSSVEFKLDKRIFNVGSDISSTGMGALDVLSNVPSVTVDIEGQIALRGNTGVQILINGKPSVMSDEGSNALGTLTGDMIERIEVITNPSAKYQAEGTSGIINIVLKKEEKKGFNGSISANAGVPANHSLGVSLNRRTENFNFFTQMGAGHRSLPQYRKSEMFNRLDSSSVKSTGLEYRNEDFYNVLLGTDYHINSWNVLTLSGNFALEVEDQPSATRFELYDGSGALFSAYERRENTQALNPKYQYDLQYRRTFPDHKDHEFVMSTQAHFFGKELEADFENTPTVGWAPADQQTQTQFYERTFTHKIDHTQPLGSRLTLERGGMYEFRDVGNAYTVSNLEQGVWISDPNFTNDFRYRQSVYGLYITAAFEQERWGTKLGLRGEQTGLNTLLVTTGEENDTTYINLFPTLHATYKLSSQISFQGGYSRRIFRPRLWDLNPFFNVRNNYNIRQGNPDLLPELADSYEATAIFLTPKWSLNSSLYHLYTTQVIERITTVKENISTTLPMNVGVRRKTGLELNGKISPNKWSTLNGDFNYGYFARSGNFGGQIFDFQGDQWNSRMTAKFKLPHGLEFEVSGQWESRVRTVQGEISGFAFLDAGARLKLWKGRGVLNLGARDLFASRIRESLMEQNAFSAYSFGMRGRFLTLGFSYSLGKGEAMSYSGKQHR